MASRGGGLQEKMAITYRDKNNSNKTPLCIRSAPLGTHERFIGDDRSPASSRRRLHAGNFPLWLAPDQVA
jgi:threonyl-tRNA synthetase